MNRLILRGGMTAIAILTLSLSSCAKEEGSKGAQPATTAPVAQTAPVPAPTPEPAAAVPATTQDYFFVEISHAEPKPTDPVKVAFPQVSVVKAEFDAKNLEGGSAEIQVSMTTIDSGVPKRDGHLGSPDYFDSAKFATASIKVTDVKAKDGETYSAMSDVTVHGISQSWPVEFTVVERAAETITIEAEHSFNRLDFGIGKAKEDPAGTDVLAKLRVTLPTI